MTKFETDKPYETDKPSNRALDHSTTLPPKELKVVNKTARSTTKYNVCVTTSSDISQDSTMPMTRLKMRPPIADICMGP